MIGFGILLGVLGFGSAIMSVAGSPITFRIVSMLEPMQPWIGIGIGIIGVAFVWFGISNKAKAAPESPTSPDGGYTPGSGA